MDHPREQLKPHVSKYFNTYMKVVLFSNLNKLDFIKAWSAMFKFRLVQPFEFHAGKQWYRVNWPWSWPPTSQPEVVLYNKWTLTPLWSNSVCTAYGEPTMRLRDGHISGPGCPQAMDLGAQGPFQALCIWHVVYGGEHRVDHPVGLELSPHERKVKAGWKRARRGP